MYLLHCSLGQERPHSLTKTWEGGEERGGEGRGGEGRGGKGEGRGGRGGEGGEGEEQVKDMRNAPNLSASIVTLPHPPTNLSPFHSLIIPLLPSLT